MTIPLSGTEADQPVAEDALDGACRKAFFG